ncbi:MAG: ABC transporter permease [Acidimicrobiia bacterium]|nr:ABC transporter permease [Acidimicrobiia bacterium]
MVDAVGWPAAAASLSLVALALVLAWAIGLRVGMEIAVASIRAAAQLLAVGLVFTAIFRSSSAWVWSWSWVVFMVIVAHRVVLRRASPAIEGLALPVAAAVAGSTAVSLAVVFGFGVLGYEPVAVVVMAGITIGNAVPVTVLATTNGVELCQDHVGEIEATLALGFTRRDVVRFFAPRAARTALIPQIERTKVVGIIALPGAMTGLLLAGVEPVQAVVIQLLVMYLVLGSATICVITMVTIVVRAAVGSDLVPATWLRADRAP